MPEPARYDSRAHRAADSKAAESPRWAERLDADGGVVEALDEQSALAAAAKLRSLGCQALVICFLHSYKNPAHERRARDLIKERFPDLGVDLSCEVWPQAREFERATLAIINAYIRPAVERQAALLTQGMAERGVQTPRPGRPLQRRHGTARHAGGAAGDGAAFRPGGRGGRPQRRRPWRPAGAPPT